MGNQYFPPTQTWISQKVSEGSAGLAEVRQHVMDIYYEPLIYFFRGHPGRWKGDATEVVNAFLADRLSRPDFFKKWQSSGTRLHKWLIGALLYFIQEEWDREKKFKRLQRVPTDYDVADNKGVDLEKEMDRMRAIQIGRRVLDIAKKSCLDDGLDKHWNIFVRHFIDGLKYTAFAEQEFEVTPEQAAVMVRLPRKRVGTALREVLERDGVDKLDLHVEIENLKEILAQN